MSCAEANPLRLGGHALYLMNGTLSEPQIARTIVDVQERIDNNVKTESVAAGAACGARSLPGIVVNSAAIQLCDGKETHYFAGEFDRQVNLPDLHVSKNNSPPLRLIDFQKEQVLERIRRDDPEWGVVLTHPTNQQVDIERANADLMVESLDAQTMTLWKWEPFYRGMWVFMTLLLCVSAALIGGLPWVTYSEMLAEGRDADSAMLLAWIDTAMIGVPLVGLIGLLLVPRAGNTRICRRTKKVFGSSGLTGLGGWVELNFNNLTAVSVTERRYHQAGRTTTYSLWLCEVDGSDRITKRIVAMQPTRHPDAPRQTWEFIRAYMHLPTDQVPPVKLASRGTRWADRVYAVNLRLFGMLVDDETHQLTGGFNRAFAVFLGAVMYPWEITAWLLEMILRERALPEALQRVLNQPAVLPNPYRTQEGRVAEEAKVQAVARADGWLHALGAALSVVFYGWVIFLWMGAGAK